LNWRCSPMTFWMSLPTVLRRTISLKALGESYDFLLGLGITIIVDFLKCEGQYSTLIQALAMLIMTLRQSSSLKIVFKWLHDNLSELGADELLQLASASLNSSFEKVGQDEMSLSVISSRILTSTWWWSAVLNVKWRAFQRSSILRHWWLLYLMDSIVGNLCLLTQFISSQGPHFLLAISWILSSKKIHFVDLTMLLNTFQFSKFLVVLYLFRARLQLLFH